MCAKSLSSFSALLFIVIILLWTSLSYGDLIAFYQFEDNANDSSGNNLNGKFIGKANIVNDTVRGNVLSLDGQGSYVDCGDPNTLNIRYEITIACWIKPAGFEREYQTFIAKGDDSYRLSRAGDKDNSHFGCGGLSPEWFDGKTNVNDGKWHHITGVYDGSTMQLYVDGILDASRRATGIIDISKAPLFIGENPQKKGRCFMGLMDDVAIFDCALDANQVGQLYRGITPSTSGSQSRIWPQVNLAISNIEQKNEVAAEAAIQKLLTDFANDKDIANGILKIADTLRRLGGTRNHKALEIYQYVIQNWPKSENAFLAQIQMAYIYLELSDDTKFESAVVELLTSFADHKDIAFTIDGLTTKCLETQWHNVEYKSDDVEKIRFYDGMIRKLANYIIENNQDNAYTMMARRAIATADIQTGDFAAAEVAIQKLLTEDSNKDLPRELYFMGGSYQRMGQHEKAKLLYQRILEKWPDNTSMMILSLSGIATTDIALDNETAAMQKLDSLIANYRDHLDLPKAVYMIGEEFAAQGHHKNRQGLKDQANENYMKALGVWRRLIMELPPSVYTQHAWVHSGFAYSRLKDYEKALEIYQKVVDEWPNHEYAWNAQTMVGICYEKLIETGRVSKSEAEPKIEQAYKTMIDKYPEHSYVKRAYLKLAGAAIEKSKWSDAAGYYEDLIIKYPEDKRNMFFLQSLGKVYEKMGNLEQATQVDQIIAQQGNPDNRYVKETIMKLAKEAYRNAKWNEAAGYYEHLLNNVSDNSGGAVVFYSLGRTYEQMGRLEEALKVYQQSLQQGETEDRHVKNSHLRLAKVAERRGQWNEAAGYYEMFLNNYPDDQQYMVILYSLGRVYEMTNKSEMAAELYQMLVEQGNPEDRHVIRSKMRLERMEGVEK